MPGTRKPMRYAHSDGHTDVCYTDDGKHILTCGSEGDIRIWAGLEDDDPTSHCVGGKALAVAYKGDHIYVGSDNNNVQMYTFPEGNRDGIITRFTAPVTHIAISKSGNLIAAGSCDMEIQVYFTNEKSSKTLTGHSAPILGLSIDPLEKYLVSSSCDGSVRVWDLAKAEMAHVWHCLKSSNSFFLSESLGRTSWQPIDGRYLAVPEEKYIRIYKRGSWETEVTFCDSKAKKFYSIVTFSPCGKYLAAGTTGGDIFVWDVILQTCISYTAHENNFTITGLAWNPIGSGEIAFCDLTGQFGTVVDLLSAESMDNHTKALNNPSNEDENTFYPFIEEQPDDDDDGENVFSLEKIKASVTQPTEDNLESLSNFGGHDDAESKISEAEDRAPALLCDIQPPFQPTSTPVHFQHRFMVWNSVGIIRCYNTEEENSIDIEFHDTSIHHALHFNNYLHHTMADLSDEGIVMACEAQDETPSKIVCILVNATGDSKEWNIELPEGEEVLAVTVSKRWLAAATDTRNLRLFTITGTQREIVALPGPIVCLAGHREKLLVVFHNGSGLSYAVFRVSTTTLQTITPFQPLPLSPKSSLSWAGFSDEGSPSAYDSAGVLYILSSKGFWLPVCQTRTFCKNKSDNMFVLGLSERFQKVKCILCKGAKYPATVPRPTISEISLQLPLCELTAEKSQLEEKYWRSQLSCAVLDNLSNPDTSCSFEKDAMEKIMRESIFKLYVLATRSGLERRAIDLCKMMEGHHAVEVAIKFAVKEGRVHLAEQLSHIAKQKKQEELEVESDITNSMYLRNTYWKNNEKEISQDDEQEDVQEVNDSEPDMFVSRPESKNGSAGTKQVHLLMAAKQKKSETAAKSVLSDTPKRCNPFKTTLPQVEPGKGLEHLNTSYVEMINKKKSANLMQPPSISKAKQKSLANKPALNKNTVTFVHWFAQEKIVLQEEFPNMSNSELTRLGMKRYKEYTQKMAENAKNASVKENSTIKTTVNETPTSENENQRNGNVGNFVEWFAREKDSLQMKFPDFNTSELTREGMKCFKEFKAKEKEMASEAPAEDTMNKRKFAELESEDDNPSKKTATPASKLAAFAFDRS